LNQITDWTVAILNAKESKQTKQVDNLGELRLTLRNGEKVSENLVLIDKAVLSPSHEGIDLKFYKNSIAEGKEDYPQNTGAHIRHKRAQKRALLLLYPIYGNLYSENEVEHDHGNRLSPRRRMLLFTSASPSRYFALTFENLRAPFDRPPLWLKPVDGELAIWSCSVGPITRISTENPLCCGWLWTRCPLKCIASEPGSLRNKGEFSLGGLVSILVISPERCCHH